MLSSYDTESKMRIQKVKRKYRINRIWFIEKFTPACKVRMNFLSYVTNLKKETGYLAENF